MTVIRVQHHFGSCSLPTAAMLIVVLAASGCATTGQRVSLNCSFNNGSVASTLADAAGCTHTLVTSVQERLDQHEQNMSLARIGTIAGTLGAMTAALYQGHRDLIVGLGLVGGASYIYGNLFNPPAYITIYSAGLDAAVCTDGIARQAAGTAISLKATHAVLREATNQLRAAIQIYPRASVAARQDADRAADAAEQALSLADGALAQEAQFANGLVTVAHDISWVVDQQILANMPNPQAFRDAAQQVLAMAQGFVPAAPAAPAPATRIAELKFKADEDPEQTRALRAAAQVVTENTGRLKTVLAAFGAPDANPCVAKARNAGIKPFALSPSNDTTLLAKDTAYVVTPSGGQPPYYGTWVGKEAPVAQIEMARSGDSFRFLGKGALTEDYVYVIRDSSNGTKQITFQKPN